MGKIRNKQKMGRTNTVIKLGLGDEVSRLRATGLSYDQIVEELGRQGHRVNKTSIFRFLKKYGDNIREALDADQVAEYYMDADWQLFKINQSLMNMFEKAAGAEDTDTMLRTADRLHQNLGLFYKRQGELGEAPQTQENLEEIQEQIQALIGFIYEKHPELKEEFVRHVKQIKGKEN